MQPDADHDGRHAPGPTPPCAVELGVIADKVVASLAGEVPRERVQELLLDLLDQEFSSARVTLFLPIFLHRVACETLRREAWPQGRRP